MWPIVCLPELSIHQTRVLEKLAGNSFINRKDLLEPLFFPDTRGVLRQTATGV